MRALAPLLLTAALVAGCAPGDEPAAPVAAVEADLAKEPLPPGDALPEDVEDMLTGSMRQCRRDVECPGRVCYFGTCLGLLLVDQRWTQESIIDALMARVTADPRLRPRVVTRLREIFARPNTDLAFRARALLALEALGDSDTLAAALEGSDERLASAAALGLTRLGDPRGMALAQALTESDQQPVAVEALRALGTSRRPEALPALLRHLTPDLDRQLLRPAIIALGDLGDPRAIRPLVSFLKESPDYLVVRTVEALRALTKAELGRDVDGWAAWIQANEPPQPPEVKRREPEDPPDIGLPDP